MLLLLLLLLLCLFDHLLFQRVPLRQRLGALLSLPLLHVLLLPLLLCLFLLVLQQLLLLPHLLQQARPTKEKVAEEVLQTLQRHDTDIRNVHSRICGTADAPAANLEDALQSARGRSPP